MKNEQEIISEFEYKIQHLNSETCICCKRSKEAFVDGLENYKVFITDRTIKELQERIENAIATCEIKKKKSYKTEEEIEILDYRIEYLNSVINFIDKMKNNNKPRVKPFYS